MQTHLPESFFTAGGLLLGAGLWWIWPPLCLVVLGLLLLAVGIVGAFRWAS